jgi:hypothetical protein
VNGTATTIGALLGAAGAVLALVPRAPAATLAGLAGLATGMGFLAYALVPGEDVEAAVSTAPRIVALAAFVAVVIASGFALASRPALIPPLTLGVAPFRVPVELGTSEARLLLPLYAVLAAAAVALVVRLVRKSPVLDLPTAVSVPIATLVAVFAVSLTWSGDLQAGTIELLFFIFPFAALAAVVARSPLAPWSTRVLGTVVVALACGFAAVGLSQLWTGELYFARDLEVANAYTTFFRTTSLFGDSSIYGRELALAILAIVTALWLRGIRFRVAVPLLALLWTALFFSYSQSTMVSLVVALLAVSLVAADQLNRRIIGVFTVLCVAVAATVVVVEVQGEDVDRATSGRFALVESTWAVFTDNPVVGVGLGAQPKASAEEAADGRSKARNVSHTTPLTVAAETGVVGLLAFAAFLAGSAWVLLAAVRRSRGLGLALAASYLLLFVHAVFYSGFFQNPTVWIILGVASAVAASVPEQAPAHVGTPAAGARPAEPSPG